LDVQDEEVGLVVGEDAAASTRAGDCRRLERDTTSSVYSAGVGRKFEREDGVVGGKERTRVREERKNGTSLETPPSEHIQLLRGRVSNNYLNYN